MSMHDHHPPTHSSGGGSHDYPHGDVKGSEPATYSCPMCHGVDKALEHDSVSDVRGPYTCPMHPEIEQDEPGSCPICGMALELKVVRAELEEDGELRDMTRRLGNDVSGGSLRTIEFARKHKKPCAHISRAGNHKPAEALQRFVEAHGIKILNVAGARESKEPGIYVWVYDVIEDACFWSLRHPGMLGGPGEG